MSILRYFLAVLALALPAAGQAINAGKLLPVEEAFSLSAEAVGPDTVRLTWDIAEGYYLYRGRFHFESATGDVRVAGVKLPPGEPHVDEFFGRVETYRGQVSAVVTLDGANPGQRVAIATRLQGCADVGVCYPPHEQTVTVSLPVAATPLTGRRPQPPPARGASTAAQDDFNLGGDAGGGTGGLMSALTSPDPGANAIRADGLLPAKQAFRFEAIALEPEVIGVRLTAAPGYYLYRHKIDFELKNAGSVRIREVALPTGRAKHDPHFGDVRVYYGQVNIPVKLARGDPAPKRVTLVGHFQGCKEDSICYPPMTRDIQVVLQRTTRAALGANGGGNGTASGGQGEQLVTATEQGRLAASLLSGNLWAALGLFFGAGLLLAFTPCVFPMVPILAGILAGQGRSLTTRRAFALSLVYVLCMALTYTAAGVIAGLFGQNLQALFQQPWILIAFSAVFVLLALSMFGFYDLQLPGRWQAKLTTLSNSQRGGTYAGVAIMGLLSALIVGPCVAPALAAALIVIGKMGDPVLGGSALFVLSLGMGVPLLIIGASAGRLLPRAGAWMETVKRVFGVLMLALAVWMLSRILPAAVTMALWGVLLVGTAVWLLLSAAGGRWRIVSRSAGVVLLVAGAGELTGAMIGGGTWLQPLRGLKGGAGATHELVFRPVGSPADLDRALSRAASRGRPVMLDFYADWCVDCKRMEAYTYPDPAVQRALANVLLLKADVTAMDAGDQALLERFNLIGPPATLFFVDGEELRRHRLIGYLDAEAFTAHVRRALGSAAGPAPASSAALAP